MAVTCPRCERTIEFSGDRPSFCPYCGVNLSTTHLPSATEQTAAYVPIPTDFTIDDTHSNGIPGANSVPSSIGGFRLTRLLGAGGMGEVYEGISDDSGQRVAVKLLTTMAKASSSSLDRFRQEGRLASQLSHPNCVFVLDADEDAGRPYIVMELMPGETLREYVQAHGPLPADEAIAKILDVIDGLIEAHRLNILHRDVKPSNCFLMADGRVKIGDFGLSKSLSVDGNLTQTGSFLGTVLYAAPEQIKGETLDFSADIYSVAATMYFLLTGQAPFQHESPTAVISRVITESPPDIRLRRPDLPRRLQKIVMRGLERQPEKRFQSLEELRAALVELVCRPVTRGSLGTRFAAFVIDSIVLMPAWISLAVLETALEKHGGPLFLMPELVYYASTEYLWGCSLGKWVLRLRVRDVCGSPPSFLRVVARTLAFMGLVYGTGLVGDIVFDKENNRFVLLRAGIYFAGIVSIFLPMRARNGFRGLHEWLSGTRVVQLPWPRPTRRIVPRDEWSAKLEPLSTVPELPSSFGGFQPSGIADRHDKTLRLHLCDSMLRRDVLLIVRPEGERSIDETRRSLSRPQRTRWLAGGVTDAWAWDAFLAPTGTPLTGIAVNGQSLGWPGTVAILEQICDELEQAKEDGTLTGPISANHVYVRPDGQVQLLDPLGNESLADNEGLTLIREIVPLALEGRSRPRDRAGPVRAVMPLHASATVNRLFGDGPPVSNLGEFRTALREVEALPHETVTPQRIVSLGFQGVMTGLPIVLLLLMSGLFGAIAFEFPNAERLSWNHALTILAQHSDEVIQQYRELEDAGRFQAVVERAHTLSSQFTDYVSDTPVGLNVFERVALRGYESMLRQPLTMRMAADHIDRLATTKPEDLPSPIHRTNWARAFRNDLMEAFVFLSFVVAIMLVAWSLLTRGGMSFALAGLALVRTDGRRAARWQCALRAMLIWVPPLLFMCLCVAVKNWSPQWVFVHNALWFAALLWLVSYAVIGILRPGRGPQDRLSGVWVVPR